MIFTAPGIFKGKIEDRGVIPKNMPMTPKQKNGLGRLHERQGTGGMDANGSNDGKSRMFKALIYVLSANVSQVSNDNTGDNDEDLLLSFYPVTMRIKGIQPWMMGGLKP